MQNIFKLVITIDGPAGAGKGTVAKFLSEKYNLKYLDTGLLYRLIAFEHYIHPKQNLSDIAKNISKYKVSDSIRSENIGNLASKIAKNPRIREILTNYMRTFVMESQYKAILDGRDTGSVVWPEANIKFYLTADTEIRMLRRSNQILSEQELHLIKERDRRDLVRKNAPLIIPKGAYAIDTTCKDENQTLKEVIRIVDNYLLNYS